MKTTFLAALVAAAIALPSFGQATPAPTAKGKAEAKATPKDCAKLAKAQGKKTKKTAKPKREVKAAG